MTLTLEEVLNKVASDHSLTSVAVGRMPVEGRLLYSATVHYTGYARDGIGCSSAYSDDSIRDALFEALKKATANRTPAATMPMELPAFDAAAA